MTGKDFEYFYEIEHRKIPKIFRPKNSLVWKLITVIAIFVYLSLVVFTILPYTPDTERLVYATNYETATVNLLEYNQTLVLILVLSSIIVLGLLAWIYLCYWFQKKAYAKASDFYADYGRWERVQIELDYRKVLNEQKIF